MKGDLLGVPIVGNSRRSEPQMDRSELLGRAVHPVSNHRHMLLACATG